MRGGQPGIGGSSPGGGSGADNTYGGGNYRGNTRTSEEEKDWFAEAQAELDEGYAAALAHIFAGEEKAAAAIIAAAEKSVAGILESYQVGERGIREFWGKAKAVLQPIIRQGRFASDEMASMLGIPDSQGRRRPYDTRMLEQTPGYQWRFEQGGKALSNQAVGNALSGEQVKEAIGFGQGLASQYFNDRVQQLGVLAGYGANAAGQQAQLATNVGGQLAGLASWRGGALSEAHGREGAGLAGIHMGAGESAAGASLAHTQGNLDIIAAQQNIELADRVRETNARTSRSNGLLGALGTIGGAVIGGITGGPAGVAAGASVGGTLLSKGGSSGGGAGQGVQYNPINYDIGVLPQSDYDPYNNEYLGGSSWTNTGAAGQGIGYGYNNGVPLYSWN
jgi:hypothetical protein